MNAFALHPKEGCNGFFSNLVYLLNNVTANKIVGKYWVLHPSQYFPPILLAIYQYKHHFKNILNTFPNSKEIKYLSFSLREDAMVMGHVCGQTLKITVKNLLAPPWNTCKNWFAPPEMYTKKLFAPPPWNAYKKWFAPPWNVYKKWFAPPLKCI